MLSSIVAILHGAVSLLFYLVYSFVYVITVTVETAVFEVFPLAYQMLLWGFEFLFSCATLLSRSVSHVAIYSYETVLLMNWQYIFQAFSEILYEVTKGVVICGSTVFSGLEFLFTHFVSLLAAVVGSAYQMLLWGFDFLFSSATLLIRSVSHVAIYSYETVVLMNWQYVFQAFSEILYVVPKGIVICGSTVFSGLEFLFTHFLSLLTAVVGTAFKAASFVLFQSWYVPGKIVETVGSGIDGGSEMISLLADSVISSHAIKHVFIVVVYLLGIIILVFVLVPYSAAIFRYLMQSLKNVSIKFTNNAAQRRTVVERPNIVDMLRTRREDDWREDDRSERWLEGRQRSGESQEERFNERSQSPHRASSSIRHRQSDSSTDQNMQDQEKLKMELDKAKKLLAKQEEDRLCAVCYDNLRTVVVHPCNHYCLCEKCRRELRVCPICNTRISSSEKIYNV